MVTVNNGLIKAIGLGSASVTVTTHEGGYSKQCFVTVASKCVSSGTNSDVSNIKLYSGSNYPKSSNDAWTVQSSDVYDGTSALQSGNRIDRSYDSYVGGIVYGSGTISFWWKVSSSSYDKLRFYVEGTSKAEIYGIGSDWQYVSIKLDGAYQHRVRWTYNNYNSSYAKAGEDCGWVDCIRWKPDASTSNPPTQIVITGDDSITVQQSKTYSGKLYFQSGTYALLSSMNELLFGSGEILAIWSIDQTNTQATINPYTGVLSANGSSGFVTIRATYSVNGVTVSATKIVQITE